MDGFMGGGMFGDDSSICSVACLPEREGWRREGGREGAVMEGGEGEGGS